MSHFYNMSIYVSTDKSNTYKLILPNGTNDCQDYGCMSDDELKEEVYKYIYPKYYGWIFIALFMMVFAFGTIGNFLVCYAVLKSVHLKSVTNYFLVNLSVADFMVILICLPPTLVHDVAQTWFLGMVMCKLVIYSQKVSVLVSVLTLTAISVERYLAICHPLSFRETKFKTRLAIWIIWTISIITAIPDLIFLTLVPDDVIPETLAPLLTSCKPSDDDKELKYQLFLTACFYFLPILVMGYTYVRIALCLWTSTKAGPATSDQGSEVQSRHLRSRRRTAKMLIVVVVVFILCYLPVYLFNILRYIGALEGLADHDAVLAIALTSHWLCYFNSAINPVIYNFMSGKFRKQFKAACSCSTPISHCFTRKLNGNPESNSLTTRSSPFKPIYGHYSQPQTSQADSYRTEMTRIRSTTA